MSTGSNAVFLSYAREDTAAAQRIAEALRSHGVEVWFDQSELRGGDAWDQKIRRQIGECSLFIPVVSQHTQERSKRYFRLEWKLAVEQTHLMLEGVPYPIISLTMQSSVGPPPSAGSEPCVARHCAATTAGAGRTGSPTGRFSTDLCGLAASASPTPIGALLFIRGKPYDSMVSVEHIIIRRSSPSVVCLPRRSS